MSDFVRYQHIERIGLCGNELDGLLQGQVYVYPKIDGSNHCAYYDKDLGRLAYASRNQLLSEGYDSTGFWHFANDHPSIGRFIEEHPKLRLYGEYLTPHTIKDYLDDAWKKWYIFDIWDDEQEKWLGHTEVKVAVDELNDKDIICIPEIAILNDPTVDDLMEVMEHDRFLLKDGCKGEGIVIKNYDYVNPYGRRTWGKIVRETFKAKAHSKNKGEKEILPEEKATDDSITQEFVSKEFHKFTTDRGIQWHMSMTPDFLRYIWREWWTDCSFDALSDMKTVDMRTVRRTVSSKVMRLLNRIGRQ